MHGKIAAAVVGAGIVLMLLYKVIVPLFEDSHQVSSSDAGAADKTKLVVVKDNWFGYYPLCSREMKKRMRASGHNYQCVDDNADYKGRMAKLAAGDVQFAVATIDAYLLNGFAQKYPGVIVAVIDESQGGDAIVANTARIASLEDLKQGEIRIAYTPDSPSEHLLKSIAVHFDIPALQKEGRWSVPTDGSAGALKQLKKDKVPVAVLWEPDVSRALADKDYGVLISSADTEKLIVDILLVNRDFALVEPDSVKTLLRNYFLTLKHYRSHPEKFIADAKKETGLSEAQVKTMLAGVSWKSLSNNATQWFGARTGMVGGADGLIDAIMSASKILVDAGDFSDMPLPDDDPYRLTNRTFVSQLYEQGGFDPPPVTAPGVDSLTRVFSTLSSGQWKALREVGTLKVRPIIFQQGTRQLTIDGKIEVDKAIENLKHYPNFRVLVKGHTNRLGDPEVNHALSQQRAESVVRYITVTYGIDPNRLRATGMGSTQPLPRNPGESHRAYNYRLQRVEMYLMADDF